MIEKEIKTSLVVYDPRHDAMHFFERMSSGNIRYTYFTSWSFEGYEAFRSEDYIAVLFDSDEILIEE